MNKIIKRLIESLFDDDFNDIYDDTPESNVSTQIGDSLKITSLAQCDNKDEVNEYFINKLNLNDEISNTVIDVMNMIKKSTTSDNYFWSSRFDCKSLDAENRNISISSNYYRIPGDDKTTDIYTISCYIGQDKDFKFEIKQVPYEITYRNKPVNVLAWAVSINGNNIIWTLIRKPMVMTRRGPGGKDKNAPINKIIDKYNETEFPDNNKKLQEILESAKQYVEYKFHTQRITDELTCTGKVYKVTQKDIDRMSKCLSTGNYSGFDKITKPDKMVARLVALFICAKNQGIKDMQLYFDDNILLSVINGQSSYTSEISYSSRGRYSTRKVIRNNDDYIKILRHIQKFPTIHLKDIIATYNAYKDQF